MTHFAIFGIHPRLSLAEIRALCPNASSPSTIGPAALIDDPDWNGDLLMSQLGGTTKLGDIIATVPSDTLTGAVLADILRWQSDEAIDFGCSLYSQNQYTLKRLRRLPLELKKALKTHGISSRWVTGKDGEDLAPAAVKKLDLDRRGHDLCIFLQEGTAHIGVTTHVQDADAWSLRDYGRPARDDENGMLPPKLARMMVNLARVQPGTTLLDPFCGSGTILMEAALATDAAHIIGTDIAQKQISDTQQNTNWLLANGVFRASDATRITTHLCDSRQLSTDIIPKPVDAVVTEGYLGPPLRGHESQTILDRNTAEITELWKATLTRLRPLVAPHARLVCIWPAFKTAPGMARVNLEQDLESLGYRLVEPFFGWNVPAGPLLYHRAGQKVMRRIAIIEPK